MRDFPVPVVAFGAGSQPADEPMDYLSMPHDMTTFSMPTYSLEADPDVREAACGVLEALRTAMRRQDDARIELSGLPGGVVELINQSLGQGEVSALVREPQDWHIQETAFAGVWRVQALSGQGLLLRDFLHAGPIPPEVPASALAASGEVVAPPLRPGMMNAPAVLNELLERSCRYRPGQPVHVVNFSLLPMTPEDLEYLFDACGLGAVSMLSRGYGNCRITGTRLAHVWWVQYFNSMDQLILNTMEVADVPEAALAAAEDRAESAERLDEWLSAVRGE